jgi:excisionase family DNA binding protein
MATYPHPSPPLSLPQVARELGVCESSVRRWVRTGILPAVVVGPAKRYRIDPGDLDLVRQPAERSA